MLISNKYKKWLSLYENRKYTRDIKLIVAEHNSISI